MLSTNIPSSEGEVVCIKKKTKAQFIRTEFAVYISQVFMFFVVAALTSNMLKDEVTFTIYINSKINDHSLAEVGYIIIATLFTLGILSVIARVIKPTEWLESLANEVLNEVPRSIYFFGSSATGAIVAITFFVYNHPEIKAPPVSAWLFIGTIFGLGAFIYGCGINYVLKRKTHIT